MVAGKNRGEAEVVARDRQKIASSRGAEKKAVRQAAAVRLEISFCHFMDALLA
jgi:hypothetical protein